MSETETETETAVESFVIPIDDNTVLRKPGSGVGFLATADVATPRTYTIEDLHMEKLKSMDGPEKLEYVATLSDGTENGGIKMVLNSTNRQILQAEFGPRKGDIVGHKIEVSRTKRSFEGRLVDGKAVRAIHGERAAQ